jgi:hypothetical protein
MGVDMAEAFGASPSVTADERGRSRLWRSLTLVVLAIQGGLLLWLALTTFPAVDEIGHLPAGVQHVRRLEFSLYPVNPPLVRSIATIPAGFGEADFDWNRATRAASGSRPEFLIGRRFIEERGLSAMRYFAQARIMCIPLVLLGGWVCFLWGRELYGGPSGLLAAALWSMCPNVLGHGTFITPDVAAASLGLSAQYAFWRWTRKPTTRQAVLAGVMLGVCNLTKFTWLSLFVAWPLIASLVIPRWGHRGAVLRNAARPLLLGLLCQVLVAVAVINAGYAFESPFQRLDSFQFLARKYGGGGLGTLPPSTGNAFSGTSLGALRVPLPAAYVQGLEYLFAEYEHGYPSFLLGEWRHGGWAYYYLVAFVVKVPLGTLGLMAGAAVVRCVGRHRYTAHWRSEVVLLAPAALVFLSVSSQTGFNHHFRYVIPGLPFLFVFASSLARAYANGHRVVLGLTLGLTLCTFAATTVSLPYCVSFFNSLATCLGGGHRVLTNSNVDWGQDLLRAQRWLKDAGVAGPVGVAAFHWIDPRTVGFNSYYPATIAKGTGRPNAGAGPLPGWYLISRCELVGRPNELSSTWGRDHATFMSEPNLRYFELFSPVATFGESMNVYHVSEAEANEVRGQLGLPLLPSVGKSHEEDAASE